MSNVLSEEKKQQVIALGKLGWSLRRIEEATGVRRETAGAYLRTAGVVVCLPGWGRRAPAKPAMQATPDPESKPAIQVTPDFNAAFSRKPPVSSTREGYRERIEEGLARGRNGKAIWQDLVSEFLQAVEGYSVAGHLGRFMAWHLPVVETVNFRVFFWLKLPCCGSQKESKHLAVPRP